MISIKLSGQCEPGVKPSTTSATEQKSKMNAKVVKNARAIFIKMSAEKG